MKTGDVNVKDSWRPGAEHHPADEECESDGCLMEPAGYAHATEWCDDHRDAIGTYLAAATA